MHSIGVVPPLTSLFTFRSLTLNLLHTLNSFLFLFFFLVFKLDYQCFSIVNRGEYNENGLGGWVEKAYHNQLANQGLP